MGNPGLSRASVLSAGISTGVLNLFGAPAVRAASTAAIKVLCGGALRAPMTELIPPFQQSSGDDVSIAYAVVGALMDRIQKGELADIAILTPAQIDTLAQQGTIAPGSRVNITKVGIGVFARNRAPPPDIGSPEAFKRALQSKTINSDVTADLFQAVARGDADLGMAQMPEIAAATNVQLVGPLPAAIQSYTSFAAGIFAGSGQPQAAKAFLDFISAHAATVFAKARGFDAF